MTKDRTVAVLLLIVAAGFTYIGWFLPVNVLLRIVLTLFAVALTVIALPFLFEYTGDDWLDKDTL